jgi:hypothetical protein
MNSRLAVARRDALFASAEIIFRGRVAFVKRIAYATHSAVLLAALFRRTGLLLWPRGCQGQSDDDSNRDFGEAMKRDDPRGVRTRDEDNDGERNARITVRASFHAECDAQKSDHKYRRCEDKKILAKLHGQKRSNQCAQRSSSDAFHRNNQRSAQR